MSIEFREMTPDDYAEVIDLWQKSPGIGLSSADSKENIARYLKRNPGLSFTARDGHRIVGAVLCGHDGRRGYIHHLAVSAAYQKQGIGHALAEKCLHALQQIDIRKCHIFVYTDNHQAITFWSNSGWVERVELVLMSKDIPAAQEPFRSAE